MRIPFVLTGIFASLVLVSLPTSSYANPPKVDSQIMVDCAAFLKRQVYTPAWFYNYGEQAVTKEKAVEAFETAKRIHQCEGDMQGVEKARKKIANVDKINFRQNRKEEIKGLETDIATDRKRGDNASIAKAEARIEQIRRIQD